MKICYGLIVYTKPHETKRLIDTINVNENYVVIHVDIKSEDLYQELIKKYEDDKNIFFVKDRLSSSWGTSKLAEVNLKLFQIAKDLDFDYFTLLSESCLPIKTDSEIKEFLSNNYGKEFMECRLQPFMRSRLHLYHKKFTPFMIKHRHWVAVKEVTLDLLFGWLIGNKNFKTWKLYYGTQWLTITKNFLVYTYDYMIKNDEIKKYEYTMMCDEHVYQKVMVNSPFKKNLYKNGCREACLVYIDWNVIESPKKLTMDDLKYFENNPNFLYARKFEPKVDQEVIEYVYKNLREKNKSVN